MAGLLVLARNSHEPQITMSKAVAEMGPKHTEHPCVVSNPSKKARDARKAKNSMKLKVTHSKHDLALRIKQIIGQSGKPSDEHNEEQR